MILETLLTLSRITFGLILLLFIPGYLITGALYPRKDDLSIIERLAYSFVLSTASVIITVLFMDIALGIDITPLNIVLMLLLVCAIAATYWNFRLFLLNRKIEEGSPNFGENKNPRKIFEDLFVNVRSKLKKIIKR